GGKNPFGNQDAAADKLFLGVKDDVWQRQTYVIFYNLLDNYERQTGIRETLTPQERQETIAFVNAIMETKPMQYCHNLLVKKGRAPADEGEFKDLLMKLWFYFYRRETDFDSSGFEHVFVGEVKNGKVTGLHNWIQFYIEERKGNIDYRGFIRPRRRGQGVENPDGNERILTVQMEWGDELKPISTIFIGTSPEFEMALYTLCFLAGGEENLIDIEQYDVMIKCYRMGRDRDQIGTAFPEVVGVDQ
ncbi:unnamed protein product, partial [Ostreobium quekettii]